MEHFKRVLMIAPTADAWMHSGILSYKLWLLKRDPSAQEPDIQLLQDAISFLTEANILDVVRPQISAWLVICSAELGQVQMAMQAYRQVMCHIDRLDISTATELSEVLLRFSDEESPALLWQRKLVRQGRYAKEALALAQVILKRSESGVGHHLAAQAHMNLGDDLAAVQELRVAIPFFDDDPEYQDAVVDAARACAKRLLGEPEWAMIVEQEVASAKERASQRAESAEAAYLPT